MVQELIDTLATAAARIEEAAFLGSAVILPDFPRSIQFQKSTCGLHCVHTILKYFGKNCPFEHLKVDLQTDADGTAVTDIKQVLRKHSLKVRELHDARLSDVGRSIRNGSPMLLSLFDGEHYSVVFGVSSSRIYVMNPSLGWMGSWRCAIRIDRFRRKWDRWALIVSERRS